MFNSYLAKKLSIINTTSHSLCAADSGSSPRHTQPLDTPVAATNPRPLIPGRGWMTRSQAMGLLSVSMPTRSLLQKHEKKEASPQQTHQLVCGPTNLMP